MDRSRLTTRAAIMDHATGADQTEFTNTRNTNQLKRMNTKSLFNELSLTPVKKPVSLKNTRNNCYRVNRIVVLEIDGVTIKGWRGFEFDGGSIPKPFWPIIGQPFDSVAIDGYFWHDLVCHTHQLSRNDADELMRAVHKRDGFAKWKREAAYRVVSALPDWYYWDNDEKDLAYIRYNYDLIGSQGFSPENDFALYLPEC